MGDSAAGAGPLALGAGLTQGAQPSPPGTEARGGEGWAGDRVAVLLPLRFHCARVASLGGVLCAPLHVWAVFPPSRAPV